MAFATMPPEIISARMYSGPGSGPMMSAASAWNGLAGELSSAARSYQTTITSLASEEWMGPASASMVTAAKPYVGWLSGTAAQAEQAATQARTAAAAFEQAYAMTVPPAMIEANRALLRELVATNMMGENTPAIAATEAQYGEMWAQDSLAMHTYAAQSAVATKLQPFAAPPHTTNLAGAADQAAAVSQATGSAAATKTLTSAPKALQMLATSTADTAPAAAGAEGATPPPGLSSVFNNPALEAGNATYGNFISSANFGMRGICAVWRGLSGGLGAAKFLGDGAKAAAGAAQAAGGAAGAASAAGGLGGLGGLGGVAGGLGQAGSIGAMSVPPSWAPAAPGSAAALGPVSGGAWEPVGGSGLMGALPEAAPHGMPGVPGAPAAGTAAAMGGRAGGGFGMPPRYGFKVAVMPRIPGLG